MMFQAGQRVVCIKAFGEGRCCNTVAIPSLNRTYQIRAIRICEFFDIPVLDLAEIVNKPCNLGGEEEGWDQRHFRPVEERKTDISTFTTILDSTKIRKPEKV